MRAIMLLVVALMATSNNTHLTGRAYPPISLPDANGGSQILLTAEIKGPETEKFYCPTVVWEMGDTEAVEESDCAPFEQRHECRESQEGCGWRGFRLDPITGEQINIVKECPCTITGYPRIWRRRIYVAPHPQGEAWEVVVRLKKNGKVIAMEPIRFFVKGA